jgi:hypothetical protein
MTPYCQLQRGFFVMRQCDRQALKACESCGRQACAQHLSASSAMRFCVDCAEGQTQRQNTDYYEDDWIYSYRSSYYRSGYRPFYYTQHDQRSFDSRADETDNFDDDTDAGGDFSDS